MKLAYKTTEEERLIVKDRRIELADAGRCINGPREGFVGARGVVHGPVVPGTTKCQRCHDVHRGHPLRPPIALAPDNVWAVALALFGYAVAAGMMRQIRTWGRR